MGCIAPIRPVACLACAVGPTQGWEIKAAQGEGGSGESAGSWAGGRDGCAHPHHAVRLHHDSCTGSGGTGRRNTTECVLCWQQVALQDMCSMCTSLSLWSMRRKPSELTYCAQHACPLDQGI